MKKINIIGVPEHFNFPWHLAIEEGAFEARGIDLQWTDVPEGTGKMCQLLESNKADIAIILTEGILKSITEGNPSKIVQTYIASPLTWGIHVGANSSFNALDELKGTKAAISRYGSGSHLMAYVNAEQQGWNTNDLQFEVINNLDGAVTALTDGKADYFMWEHFTTKPLVTDGTFRRVADCPTPWPCFVIAASEKMLSEEEAVLKHILEIINNYTIDFKQIPSIDRTLANRYEQELEDIQTWLSKTQWSEGLIKEATITKVQDQLLSLDIIDKKLAYTAIVKKV